MKTLLSILIPTVPCREKEFKKLMYRIATQSKFYKGSLDNDTLQIEYMINDDIEVLSFKDNKEMSIGEKRQKLYQSAKGIFSWQIDDDDDISDNAIELILNAIKSNPDIPCITFKERCEMNGEYKSSNHSLKYEKWQDNFDGYDYCRTPFYKDVIRTDIAKSVPFPHIRYNEDEQWSIAIKPLLTSEIHIEEELYIYIYEPKESHEKRYGIT